MIKFISKKKKFVITTELVIIMAIVSLVAIVILTTTLKTYKENYDSNSGYKTQISKDFWGTSGS